MAASVLYNEDRNLLRIREKERRNQEAHQEKEAYPEKIPLFGEPYKTEKGDELSSRIQNMLGNYEEVKEFLSSKSHPHRLDASENRLGKPRYPLFPEKGSSIPSHSFHTSAHHQPINTPASGPLPVGNISHNPKMAQPRMEPMSNPHVKSYGPPDGQHPTQDRLGQEGCSSSHHKKGDRRADGDRCALVTDSAPERELSPFLSLPSPVPPLSPVHSNQHALPRTQGSSKVHSGSSNSKGCCPAKSPKDPVVKVHDKETAQDSLVAVASLGVAPPQPPSQTFPPPPLPAKTVAMQQKPTAYVRPMDGQDQQTFEKTDLQVPAKAKLTKLKMPSQSAEEMTHSWPPPLTAIHTPSTAEPSKFPFPTKVIPYQCSRHCVHTSAEPEVSSESLFGSLHSAPQSLPEAAASAHSSSAESESTSDSDSSSDSESESSSSDSEENEPRETPAPEVPCPLQEAERQPKMAVFCPVGPESAEGHGGPAPGHERSESKDPPLRSSSKAPRGGPPPYGSKDQPSKDKPKVKTKGRPPPAKLPPSKGLSGPEPTKDNAGARSPEHFALVPLTQNQGPPHSGGGGGRTSGCRRAVVVQEDRRKDKLPGPARDPKLLSPLGDTPAPPILMVKITLDLLSRIPQLPGKGGRPRKPEDKQPPAGKKLDSEKRGADNSSKLAKKRKAEAEKDHDSKKARLEKETKSQSSSSSSHKESSKTKTSKPSSEPSKKEVLAPPPVSSSSSSTSSSSSSQKPAKPAQKRPRREADPCSQDPPQSASSNKGNHKDSSAPKHRKVEGKGSGSCTEHKGSSGDTAYPFLVPSLPNGNSKPGKPPVKLDRQQADFHMKEAKKLKQKAELMTDKVGKAFKYLEAALSLIECGIATESESPASKSAYSVYLESVDLIKFIMSLKSFSDASTPQEKIFAVLCLRCQSILNMAMFRCKKDIAIKYSRALNEHFSSFFKVAQAPSPCSARSTGTQSPLSPMPSPAGSIGSQSSAGSVGSSGMPVTIQNMTSSYVTITSHVLTAFDLWEQAEALTRKSKEFFAQLSTSVCALALNSSLTDLVHYTRQGFQRLKQAAKTP
uniref:AF4/FMR2 family member 1 n=1 Tax=Ursus maritimus TaxID=29073 RepID=A0A452VNL7_URSMA